MHITLNVNLDEIPGLPMPLAPGKHTRTLVDKTGRAGQVVTELKGNLCTANLPMDCLECREFLLGMCGRWSPSTPSEAQKTAFQKLITKVQEG